MENLSHDEQAREILPAVNAARITGDTPLFVAAQNGYLEVVQHITSVVTKAVENLSHDEQASIILPALNAATTTGGTPLFIAVQNGHLEVVQHITSVVTKAVENLSHDEQPCAMLSVLKTAETTGATPLYIAAQNGHLEVVQHITSVVRKAVEKLPNDEQPCAFFSVLNAARKIGATPLHIAAERGHLEVVQHITSVVSEAVENLSDDEQPHTMLSVLNAATTTRTTGITPLNLAAEKEHLRFWDAQYMTSSILTTDVLNDIRNDMRSYAIIPGLNADRKTGVTPLYIAAWKGHFEIVKHLIESIESIENLPNYDKMSILNAGCKGGRDTLLRIASKEGYYDIVNLLLHKGADPEKGKPWQCMSFLGKYSVFKVLTQTPRQAAIKGGHMRIARLIETAIQDRKTDATTLAIMPSVSAVTAETAM